MHPSDDPSPNSSQRPNAPESLRQRRRISGKHNLQSVFVRPVVQRDTDNLDAETLLPIKELPDSEKIVLDLGQGKYETFSVSYLLGKQLLLNHIKNGLANSHNRMDHGRSREGNIAG